MRGSHWLAAAIAFLLGAFLGPTLLGMVGIRKA